MMKFLKFIAIAIAIFLLLTFGMEELSAQCPMCRMSAESNLKDGGTEGKGLNKGILYMLAMPYLLVGTLGFIWWKNKRQYTEEIYSEPFSDN